jgi:D-alanine-D-alanine ligase
MHEDLIPPETLDGYTDDQIVQWKTEFDVVVTLKEMGHHVRPLGVYNNLAPLREVLHGWKPHIVVNLLEEFHGRALYDHSVVSYLELMRQRYTGCNPRGLLLAHDKSLCKKLLLYHRIRTPRFKVMPLGRRPRAPRHLDYPMIVKSLVEDGSYGIAQASVVRNEEKLLERIEYLHTRLHTPVIVEEFIEGRELYLSVIGNRRLEVLPPLEMVFGDLPDSQSRIATSRAKWNPKYQQTHKIDLVVARNLSEATRRELEKLGKRIYKALDLNGYARIDVRLDEQLRPYVLEVNANPDVGYGEELSCSAEAAGMDYERMLQRLINLGLQYRGIA